MPSHVEERRRIFNRAQIGWVVRLVRRDELPALLGGGVDFGVKAGQRGNAELAFPAAAASQRGKGVQRGAGAAEALQQPEKGDGPHIFRAGKAQPIALFGFTQRLGAHPAFSQG